MTICPNCSEDFENLAHHWAMNSNCRYPKITPHQREIVTGLLMGDACVHRQEGRSPNIQCKMITKEYLDFLHNEFSYLSSSVRFVMSGEENAKQNRESEFSPSASGEDYSDVYVWRSRRLPELKDFATWYSSGKKVWPDDITLTDTVLKHWYCGDGHYDNKNGANRIQIAMSNEVDNLEKVSRMFRGVGLPEPDNYRTYQQKLSDNQGCIAEFNKDNSQKLFNYMGEPLPGFKYKWPSWSISTS